MIKVVIRLNTWLGHQSLCRSWSSSFVIKLEWGQRIGVKLTCQGDKDNTSEWVVNDVRHDHMFFIFLILTRFLAQNGSTYVQLPPTDWCDGVPTGLGKKYRLGISFVHLFKVLLLFERTDEILRMFGYKLYMDATW
jgi:phage shock protein PspC (stress-responsive transcriptional regulator)